MPEQSDRLVLYHFSELVNHIPASWQVRGVLREESFILLYGKRESYKTFVALDLAASIASSISWQGHDIIRPGLVIYIAAEGGGGMVQRARAWAEQHGISPNAINMYFIIEPAVITATSEDVDTLIERIRDIIDWMPAGEIREENIGFEPPSDPYPTAREWPCLIVIDTLARCLLGDESSTEDMGKFIQGVDKLKREFRPSSILVIHHPGWSDTHERGSSSLGAACDTAYKLEADAEAGMLTMTCEKMKDGAKPKPLEMVFSVVPVTQRSTYEIEEDLSSVVIMSAGRDARTTRMLTSLQRHKILTSERWMDLAGLPKTTFHRLRVGLEESGQIIRENGHWRLCSPILKISGT